MHIPFTACVAHAHQRPQPRTEAYRLALEANPGLMNGARVLDVGCGTGILSMFAARGGAATVVGLDASERIAGFAQQVRHWASFMRRYSARYGFKLNTMLSCDVWPLAPGSRHANVLHFAHHQIPTPIRLRL